MVRRIGDAFIESHDDVRPQVLLGLGGHFRVQKLPGAVQVGPEHHPFFGDLPHLSQAEHLEAAAVGEHPPLVVHELVEAAGFPHQFRPRPQEQMVGVGQDHLGVHGIQFFRGQGLDRGLGPHRHEHGGVEGPVRGVQLAQPGPAPGIFLDEFEIDRVHFLSFNE